MIEAKCRCGAVAVKIAGKPVAQLYCHCDDCQAAHGAAYVLSAIYPASAVEVVRGQPAPMVVKATERMRCEDCGTYLYSEIARAGMRSVSAYLLPKGEFNPQFHVQCQHAILPVVDNLPHYKAFRPRLAAPKNLSTGKLHIAQLKRKCISVARNGPIAAFARPTPQTGSQRRDHARIAA